MSTDRINGMVVFICDECDEALETGEKEFDDARKVYKEEGWVNVKDQSDKWHNLCPDCK